MEEVCHSLFSNIVRDEMTEQSDVEVIHSVSQLNAAQALALLGAEGTDG
jgi:predicted nucleotidyltransferase